ncbi:MAG: hypothetical protein K0R24_1326 [Gammaproteobacteria bacterium]|jgi:hypothetical protein|nr:hypothetical protein [Gammaproteobacteria bacterium]MCE3238345.1 hypothetical protein [Gammaproteobacteria bacterium]
MKSPLKLILFCLLFLFSNILFAGSEDWQGTFTIQNPTGAQDTIIHTPTEVILFSMIYTKEFNFSGGRIHLNGFSPTQDGVLNVNMKIEEFTEQVKKFGVIVNQKVTPGSTYS